MQTTFASGSASDPNRVATPRSVDVQNCVLLPVPAERQPELGQRILRAHQHLRLRHRRAFDLRTR